MKKKKKRPSILPRSYRPPVQTEKKSGHVLVYDPSTGRSRPMPEGTEPLDPKDSVLSEFQSFLEEHPEPDFDELVSFVGGNNSKVLALMGCGVRRKDIARDCLAFRDVFRSRFPNWRELEAALYEEWGRNPLIFRMANEGEALST